MPMVTRPTRTNRLQLGVVCTASFVVWAGFGAILPYLPVFLRDQAHASLLLIGVVAAGYSVGSFAFSSPLGRLSDAIGRKPVLVIGVCLYSVATLLFVSTTEPWFFVLFRFLEGVGAAAVGPAGQAFLADITPEHERSRAYGWLTSAQFGGLVIGPALAVPLYQLGGGQGRWAFYAVFLFGSAVSALTAVAMIVLIREPADTAARRLEKPRRPPLRELLTMPVVAFVVMAFTGHYAMGAFEVVWSIYLRDLGASMSNISATWVAFSVPMLFSFIGGRLADRHSRWALMMSGYLLAAIAWIVYGATKNLTLFLIANVVEGFAFAWAFPAKQAFLVQVSPRRWVGTITGLETSSMQLATLLGSLTAPLLYRVIGGYVMSLGGGLAIIGLLWAAPVLKRTWDGIVASGEWISTTEAQRLEAEEGGSG